MWNRATALAVLSIVHVVRVPQIRANTRLSAEVRSQLFPTCQFISTFGRPKAFPLTASATKLNRNEDLGHPSWTPLVVLNESDSALCPLMFGSIVSARSSLSDK